MTYDPDIYFLKQIQRDDVGAFEVLYKKHYRMVYHFARRFINEASICQDVVQDVFTYVWDNRLQLVIKKSFKSYLLTCCHHTCLNYIKKSATSQRHLSNYMDHSPESEDGYACIYEEELRESLQQAMSELPEQCREVFQLSRLKGLKHKEIAALLNLSPKTVEVHIYRALKVLRKRLQYIELLIFYFFSLFM